jgi:MYXO-CTERM domain-containing protein
MKLELTSKLSLALVLLTAPACSHEGELGHLGFDLGPIVDPLFEFRSGDQLLVGSTICPEILHTISESDGTTYHGWVDDREAFRACYTETVTGPGTLDAAGCLGFEGPGEVIWDLSDDGCGAGDERMRFWVVEAGADTRLGFDGWRSRAIHIGASDPELELELVGLAPGRSVDELLVAPDEVHRVFAGQIDAVTMRLSDAGGRIYWMGPDVELELVGDSIERIEPVEIEGDPASEYVSPGELALRMEPGASGRVRATLPGGEVLESPELLAVGLGEVASLDVMQIGGYLYADVRDTEGRRLHAAPIDWSVTEGALGFIPGSLSNEGRTHEYAVEVDTHCEPPPESEPQTRTAVVRARLGTLEDSVTIEWVAEPPDEDAWPWSQPEACMFAETEPEPDEGCACSSAGGRGSLPAPMFGGLALLALVRRRRHPRGLEDRG